MENIKALRQWPLWGIYRWPVISPHKGQEREKCVHLMTSSCTLAGMVMLSPQMKTFLSLRIVHFGSVFHFEIDINNNDNADNRITNYLSSAKYPNEWVAQIVWWRHRLETVSALQALCVRNPSVTSGFPSQRPVTQSFILSLICIRTNSWANNRDAGLFRRYRAHHDVVVMWKNVLQWGVAIILLV